MIGAESRVRRVGEDVAGLVVGVYHDVRTRALVEWSDGEVSWSDTDGLDELVVRCFGHECGQPLYRRAAAWVDAATGRPHTCRKVAGVQTVYLGDKGDR